jgi:hypothetical protein
MILARGVRRRVALKRIHANLAEDPHFVAMFLDEARVASALLHPGVVSVLDVVEAQGELLLVMDYVPGWDLAAVLARGREVGEVWPCAAAIGIGQSIAETLHYVHRATDRQGRPLKVVHRDVNPSNILIAEDGSTRLIDFGVAKAAARSTRTLTRAIKGKLAYLAPEQAEGAEVDARSDLYGLGLVLFELLAGRRAIDDQGGDLQILERARKAEHPPLSSLRPDVPPALERVVGSLLAADPQARPSDAGVVAAELEALRAAIGASPPAVIRERVVALMGAPSRAPQLRHSALERALLGGLDGNLGPGTRAEPSDPTPPMAKRGPAPPPAPAVAPRPRSGVAGLVLGAIGVAALVALALLAPWRSASEVRPLGPGFLRISSDPPGAEVQIDGAPHGEPTPTVLTAEPGRGLEIRLEKPGFVPSSTRASAAEGETQDVHLTLREARGRLALTSAPSGAAASLDGVALGTTPIERDDLPLRAGEIELVLEGYRPAKIDAPLDRQSALSLHVDLVPLPRLGWLDVSADPWAIVFVNGRRVAESTPLIRFPLPEGSHTVKLHNPHLGKTEERRVKIREGRRSSVIVRLR